MEYAVVDCVANGGEVKEVNILLTCLTIVTAKTLVTQHKGDAIANFLSDGVAW
jgi:hypothetical protein